MDDKQRLAGRTKCGSLFVDIECVVAAAPVHIVAQTGSFNGGMHFAGDHHSRIMEKPCPMWG